MINPIKTIERSDASEKLTDRFGSESECKKALQVSTISLDNWCMLGWAYSKTGLSSPFIVSVEKTNGPGKSPFGFFGEELIQCATSTSRISILLWLLLILLFVNKIPLNVVSTCESSREKSLRVIYLCPYLCLLLAALLAFLTMNDSFY